MALRIFANKLPLHKIGKLASLSHKPSRMGGIISTKIPKTVNHWRSIAILSIDVKIEEPYLAHSHRRPRRTLAHLTTGQQTLTSPQSEFCSEQSDNR